MSPSDLHEDADDRSPAGRRREKVRRAILKAAEKVFEKEGRAGLSIRRLAETIDYSPAAIYKYFGSKNELVDVLKEAFFQRILDQVDAAKDEASPFLDRARRCVIVYVETAIEKPHHYMTAFSAFDAQACENGAPSPTWDDFTTSVKGRAFMVLVNMVREGQTLGLFDASLEPHHAAKSMWASMHGLAQLLIHAPRFPQMLPPQSKADGLIGFHADLVIRALLRRDTVSHSIGAK